MGKLLVCFAQVRFLFERPSVWELRRRVLTEPRMGARVGAATTVLPDASAAGQSQAGRSLYIEFTRPGQVFSQLRCPQRSHVTHRHDVTNRHVRDKSSHFVSPTRVMGFFFTRGLSVESLPVVQTVHHILAGEGGEEGDSAQEPQRAGAPAEEPH